MSESWIRPGPTLRERRSDALAAAAIALGAVVSALLYLRIGAFPNPAPLWLSTLAIALYTVPLVFRRKNPIIVAILVSIGFFIVGQFSVPDLLFSNIALFMSIYTVGAWCSNRRHANIARAALIVAMFSWLVVNLMVTVNDTSSLPGMSRSGVFSEFASFTVIQFLTNILYFGGAVYFGNASFSSAHQRADLESRTLELAREKEHSDAQAVALERVNIARELHDVVAHHVSVMGIQAGAARRVLVSDPTQAASSLQVVEDSARDAVDELQRLLTTLRSTDAESASTSASTRGLEQIPDLAGETEASGIPTRLTFVGEPRAVSRLASFTLYRVTQEALTNVRKHAGSHSEAEVRIRYGGDEVEVEVSNTGTVLAAPITEGMGMTGMRERLGAVDGTLEMGPRSRGGFVVRARVPAIGETA